jgi:hypothetical protein
MIDFKLKQTSLEVVQNILENNEEVISIEVISHKVGINWRQLHGSEQDKIQNINHAFDHPKPCKRKIYSREEFLGLTLNSLEKIAADEVWSVCSRVKCFGGKYKHIPMMNFHLEDVSLDVVKKSLKYILPTTRGVILESGRFFHYYGASLLSENEWRKFMAEFLMPCVLVSPRYIGHRLYAGYCSLRLTTDITYKTKVPEVVDIF